MKAIENLSAKCKIQIHHIGTSNMSFFIFSPLSQVYKTKSDLSNSSVSSANTKGVLEFVMNMNPIFDVGR